MLAVGARGEATRATRRSERARAQVAERGRRLAQEANGPAVGGGGAAREPGSALVALALPDLLGREEHEVQAVGAECALGLRHRRTHAEAV